MNWKTPDGMRKPSDGGTTPEATPATQADLASRRALLRGALAAGCSLLLPASLLGCSKKEAATEPSAPSPQSAAPSPVPMESATPSAMDQAAPAAPAKVSQASVQYQPEPKGDQKCANCMHFIPESNTCELVEGTVSPDGWCLIWTKMA